RPLGLSFAPGGELYVADARKGLLMVDAGGAVRVLATEQGGQRLGFTDDVVVARDGTVYFTDASAKYEDYALDLLEHRPNARLLSYHPSSGRLQLLMRGYFLNGVALAPDQSYLLVTETGAYRVWRVMLRGERAGRFEPFIENLPGFPDNITLGSSGRYWVAIGTPRKADVDWLLPRPFLRKAVARLPRALWPKPARYRFVLALDQPAHLL